MVRRMVWQLKKDGTIRVKPIEARDGDEILWDARKTKKPMSLFFNDRSLFGKYQLRVRGGRTARTRIRANRSGRNTWAIYTYAAYFAEHERFGEGSSPIIIVKP